jgi:hypothetical protein
MQQENLELEGGQRAQAQRLNREPKVQKESKIFQNNRKYSKIILKCSKMFPISPKNYTSFPITKFWTFYQ